MFLRYDFLNFERMNFQFVYIPISSIPRQSERFSVKILIDDSKFFLILQRHSPHKIIKVIFYEKKLEFFLRELSPIEICKKSQNAALTRTFKLLYRRTHWSYKKNARDQF